MTSFHRTRNFLLSVLIVLVLGTVAWMPQKASASGGGTAYFTDGGFAGSTTVYSYVIYGAPPNMCGTLDLYRNGNHEVTPGWVCTDNYGNATKGPWGPPTSCEVAWDIHIKWDDDSETNYLTHVNYLNPCP